MKSIAEWKVAARTSLISWWALFAQIYDRQNRLIRPRLNPYQLRWALAYETQLAAQKPIRLIGLKPRQVGGTQIASATTFHHNQRWACRSVVIGDYEDRSLEMFKRLKWMQEQDLLQWGITWKWLQDGATNSLGSEVQIFSAQVPKGTRGLPLQCLQASELAFWPDTPARSADATLTAISNSIASLPGTLVQKESTPFGASGAFFDDWNDAVWPSWETYWHRWETPAENASRRGTDYLRVFAAWYEFEDHNHDGLGGRKKLGADDLNQIKDTMTDREEALVKQYGVTLERLSWRRQTIREQCRKSEARFDQEYPADPVSCWISGGSTRFNATGLLYLTGRWPTFKRKTGNLSLQKDKVSTVFEPNVDGNFIIFEEPIVGCRYLLSVDTKSDEMVNANPEHIEHDRHSPLVLRSAYLDAAGAWHRPMVVARIAYPCQWDIDQLAEGVAALSARYGGCVVIPEVNETGGAVLVRELLRLGVPVFMTRRVDEVSGRTLEHRGWRSDKVRRKTIIEDLAKSIRDAPEDDKNYPIEIPCEHIIGELRTFMRDEHGRDAAASGKHDDDVLSLAIGYSNLDAATEFVPRGRIKESGGSLIEPRRRRRAKG